MHWRQNTLAFALIFVPWPGAMAQVSIKMPEHIMALIEEERYEDAARELKKSDVSEGMAYVWLLVKMRREDEAAVKMRSLLDASESAERTSDLIAAAVDASPSFGARVSAMVDEYSKYGDTKSVLLSKVLALVRVDRLDEASEILEIALEGEFDGDLRRRAANELAIAYQRKGNPVRSLEIFDKLASSEPETRIDPQYQMQAIHFATEAGRPAESLRRLDKLQSSFPAYYRANRRIFLLAQGLAFEALGEVEESQRRFRELVELAKSEPSARGFAQVAAAKIEEFETLKRMTEEAEAKALAENRQVESQANISKDGFDSNQRYFLGANVGLLVLLGLVFAYKTYKRRNYQTR